jgi:soluble lytic murein transglycosylase-like protein
VKVNFIADMYRRKIIDLRNAAMLVFGLALFQQSHAASVYVTKNESGRMVYTNAPVASHSTLMFRSNTLQNGSKKVALKPHRGSRQRVIPKDVSNHIQSAATEYDVEPSLISAVIQVESGFNETAISPKGARGLMQLMPETGKRYGAIDLHDVRTNIFAGTAYLRDLLLMFDGRIDLALAGYNAGENAVRRYKNTIPPYPETKHYVSAVLAEYRRAIHLR